MNAPGQVEFNWLSPLGASVILFLLYGGLYVMIGILTPLLVNPQGIANMLIISGRTDAIVFGREPSALLTEDAALRKLRLILIYMLAGLLAAAGVFHLALTWFGLRQGQPWALAALALGGLIVLPYWWLALKPYFEPSVALTLFDVPPFMWLPAALLLPAIIFGVLGLRQTF